MKKFTVTKNLFHILTKVCAGAYIMYIMAIAMVRAFSFSSLTSEDLITFALMATVLSMIFILDYTIKILHTAAKRQRRLCRSRMA